MTKSNLQIIGLIWVGLAASVGIQSRVRQEQRERPITRFELVKAASPRSARVLIVGDSRAMRGLLAEELEAKLGQSVYNFAFSAGTYSPSYLVRIESLLKEKNAVLVMGVSPWVFCQYRQENLFTRVETLNTIDRALLGRIWAGPFPFRDSLADGMTFEGTVQGTAISPVPAKLPLRWPDRWAAKELRSREKLVSETLTWITTQVKRGVRVLIVRIPSSDQNEPEDRKLLEGQIQSLWRRVAESGAEPVLPAPTGWATIDGEHLSPQSAKQLTDFVAERVKP